MAGTIKIDPERCKGCGLCIEVCSHKSVILSSNTNKMGYFFAEACGNGCTGCAACALVCPDTAIEVYREVVQKVRVIQAVPEPIPQRARKLEEKT